MIKKNKILCILHRSPPYHGASKVGDFIAKSIKLQNRYECKFITIKSSDSLESIGRFSLKKIYYLVELYINILFTLVVFRPSKIYFTSSSNGFAFYRDLVLSTLWRAYSLFKKADVFYHFHTKGVENFVIGSTVKTILVRFFLKNVNLILLSPLLESDFAKVNTYKRVLFLPNGTEDRLTINEFYKIIEDKFSDFKTLNVLYLSNMIKSKGYFRVLELAKQVKGVSIQFHFAGSWQSQKDEGEFFQFIKDNNLSDKVFFHGFVSGKEKEELFKKAHIFIFPTRYTNEAFPLSILEALSYGIPVIATDEGSIPYILNKKSGIVLSGVDNLPQVLKEAKDTLVNQKTAYYCRKHYLDNFTLDKFEDNLISVLES